MVFCCLDREPPPREGVFLVGEEVRLVVRCVRVLFELVLVVREGLELVVRAREPPVRVGRAPERVGRVLSGLRGARVLRTGFLFASINDCILFDPQRAYIKLVLRSNIIVNDYFVNILYVL